MRTGVATFTLDYGRCPPWLFEKMVRLARVAGVAIIEKFGTDEFLRRLADPVWFQSLGCVLAFDWNASGLTTTTLGALKVAFSGLERKYGFFICGGKGKTSRKTPFEIKTWGERGAVGKSKEMEKLVKISRLTAKIDSSLIQDGFQIYHHNLIFDKEGTWVVIQQGMNPQIRRARRYHWFGKKKKNNLIEEPHTGIISQIKLPTVLNLTAKKSRKTRQVSLKLVAASKALYRDLKILAQRSNPQMMFKVLELPDYEFKSHPVLGEFGKIDFENPKLKRTLKKLVIKKPENFSELLLTPGVGSKTVRALSLVAEVIYGAKPSYQDPARYSFAHGGKDGTPYPVERKTYDQTLAVMERALLQSRLYYKEKDEALRRMEKAFFGHQIVFRQ